MTPSQRLASGFAMPLFSFAQFAFLLGISAATFFLVRRYECQFLPAQLRAWIVQDGRFRKTPWIRTGLCLMLFSCACSLSSLTSGWVGFGAHADDRVASRRQWHLPDGVSLLRLRASHGTSFVVRCLRSSFPVVAAQSLRRGVPQESLSVVRTVPSLHCHEPAWNDLRPFVVLMLVAFLVVFPLALLVALVVNHKRGRLAEAKHRRRYGVL